MINLFTTIASVNNKYSSDDYVNVYCTMVKREIDSECVGVKKISFR